MNASSPAGRKFERTIRATYLLSFMGDVCTGLFGFALSLYTSIMIDQLGISGSEREFWVGMVATGWGIIYFFSAVLLGKLSDRIGRRKSLIIAMAGFIVVNLFVIFFASLPLHLFIALASVAFFFGLVFPVLEALMSEISEPFGMAFHGKALSTFMIAWSIGLTLGPLIGGLFDTYLNHLVAFGYLIVHASSFAVITILFIPGTKKLKDFIDHVPKPPETTSSVNDAIDRVPKPRLSYFKLAILLMPLVFAFCNQILFSIFPAFGEKHVTGGTIFPGMNASLVVGIVTFSLGLGRTFGFWHTGRLGIDRFPVLIVIGPAMMACSLIFIYSARTADVLLPAFTMYGLGSGYAYALSLTLLMDITRTGKGLKAGLLESTVGVGTLASTLISTYIGQLDPASPYLLAMLFALGMTVLVTGAYIWQKIKVQSAGTK